MLPSAVITWGGWSPDHESQVVQLHVCRLNWLALHQSLEASWEGIKGGVKHQLSSVCLAFFSLRELGFGSANSCFSRLFLKHMLFYPFTKPNTKGKDRVVRIYLCMQDGSDNRKYWQRFYLSNYLCLVQTDLSLQNQVANFLCCLGELKTNT